MQNSRTFQKNRRQTNTRNKLITTYMSGAQLSPSNTRYKTVRQQNMRLLSSANRFHSEKKIRHRRKASSKTQYNNIAFNNKKTAHNLCTTSLIKAYFS